MLEFRGGGGKKFFVSAETMSYDFLLNIVLFFQRDLVSEPAPGVGRVCGPRGGRG